MPDTELDLMDVLEASPVGAVIIDEQDRQVLFWNTSVLAILGGLRGEAFAAAAQVCFFRDPAEFECAWSEFCRAGELRDHETQLWRRDGVEAWALVSMRAIRFDGRAAILIWYADISEAKRRQRQLERSHDTLLDVLDAAPAGAALSDAPGRISYWNHALLVIFGDSGPEAASLIRDGIARARAEIGRQGQGCSFPVTTSTGEPRDVAAWIAPVEVDGTPSELIWLHDVTDLRQAEREARAATAAKSTFLATMSHEIRTPMNGVITIAELLSETPLDREQAAMVNIIRQSAEGLIRVINDILDFSKLEANEVQIEWLPFRLAETVDGVCQLLRAKAAEKGLALQLVLPEEDPLPRLGDALRLRQVLLNLLGNAIKFTAQGGVTLSVVADGPDVSFTVSDTGIGIPPERLDALFQPYRQAGPGTARTHGGTGLGLSISNALVQLMGGAPIAVVSQPGQGSRFGFHLELPPVPAAEAAPAAESPSGLPGRWCKPDRAVAERHGAVVLCAEDNAINRDVLARVLDRLGFCHDVTEDGQQALACLDRSRHGLLLTDGHMPNLDGWGLTREIRGAERPPGVARLPVVMLTANAVWEMQEIARDCDIDSCLTKPLRLDQLESTLLALLPVLGRLRTRADAAADSAADLPANDVPALEMSARERQAVELPALDLAALVGLVGDSPDDLAAVLADFQRSAAELGVQIRRAETAGDSVALARHAHSLKGAASTAGAARLADCAAALEQAAKQAARAAVLADAGGAVYGELAKLPGDIDRALAHHRAVTP